MANKLFNLLSRLFNKDKYDDSNIDSNPDEYELLIKNKRIKDYSKVGDQLHIPHRVGIYLDTYKFATHGLQKELAATNIENILTNLPQAYSQLKHEKNNLITNESGIFKRVFKLFEVRDLYLENGKGRYDFCLNLFIRPNDESFIVIGKTPKGKLQKLKKAEGIVKTTNSTEKSWETVDFK